MDKPEKQTPLLTQNKPIQDYRLAVRSRTVAVIGRREVLTGKAKFGIFGDGKELPQIAIANAFQPGDWRSGYYRDQTWMFALDLLNVEQFFAQLYGNTDVTAEPHSGGRNMNGHYASRLLNPDGSWRNQSNAMNSAADLAPTGSQMPRAVGLAYASVLYRQLESLSSYTQFSNRGNEVVWVTIGNASTSEGIFWEAVNAIGVLHAPVVISIYDDGYGISVPNQFQMVKENIYSILKGFERVGCPAEECDRGYNLYSVHAWDYPALTQTYQEAGEIARLYHIPALVHVTEATQPLGHSTSGSHERYKTPERLAWEKDHDCIPRFRAWLIDNQSATEAELDAIQIEETQRVEEIRKIAYAQALKPRIAWRDTVINAIRKLDTQIDSTTQAQVKSLAEAADPILRDASAALQSVLTTTRSTPTPAREALEKLYLRLNSEQEQTLGSKLNSSTPNSPEKFKLIAPIYDENAPLMQGFEIMNALFDAALARDPRVIAFGEDVGKLGDVNQGFRGLQEKYGALRVTDTGIREATILGQAIGMSLRGLRPICEIQYLDYLLYALQIMADDLATLHWRTAGGQIAPVIIRTRGHRLEGVWHSGSPMGGIIHLVRGMLVLVPRNLVQAAGFYNMLLQTDNPGLVVEVLNGYRLKEKLPSNLDQIILPPGIPEVLRPGTDVTLVTYGACVKVVLDATEQLARIGIQAEVIDVQSLLPFDTQAMISASLQKTNRVVFIDEDVPGGTTAYMLQQVLENQNGYRWLDSTPKTVTGTSHRPAYTSDGDYWSKPNPEQVFLAAYDLMHESKPNQFPTIIRTSEAL